MKRLAIIFLIISFSSLQLIGCETMDWREKGALIGAAGGALIGALIGEEKGAAIGVVAGAVIGAVAGYYYDKQVMTRTEAAKEKGYTGQGEKIEIDDSSVKPSEVTRGTKAEAIVYYTVLTPNENESVKVTETRTLVKGKESLDLAKREVMRTQGSHLSIMEFTIPNDIERGDYTFITTISGAKYPASSEASMKIS